MVWATLRRFQRHNTALHNSWVGVGRVTAWLRERWTYTFYPTTLSHGLQTDENHPPIHCRRNAALVRLTGQCRHVGILGRSRWLWRRVADSTHQLSAGCNRAMNDLYNRLDQWLRNRSRAEYALLTGAMTASILFGIGVAIGRPLGSDAMMLGLTMTVVYYWLDPNAKR